MNDEILKALLLKLIKSNNETSKADFKRTIDIHSRWGQAELIKDTLAIANVDSQTGEQTGYLIIGAHDGKLNDISTLKLDDATLQQIINSRCHKPVCFEYKQYVLENGRVTGVIIIPKSKERPHLVMKDFFDHRGNLLLHEGECPIREGTSTRKASREDFDRMYQERIDSARQRFIQEAFAIMKEGEKKPSPYDIATMDLATLNSTVFEMIRQDDLAGIRASIESIRLSTIKNWKNTEDKKIFDEEKVRTIKHLVVRPMLDRLTLIGKLAVQYKKKGLLPDVLKGLSSIYELSNARNLGISGISEHMSWTVPSKLSLENLYILGAYFTSERDIDAVIKLLSLKVRNSRKDLSLMIVHPNYLHDSGEGSLSDFFDEAIAHVTATPVFLGWFESNEERVKDSFCQFDFLIGCKTYVTEEVWRPFPNFARYYRERQSSLWNYIESNPERFKALLGDNPMKVIEQFVRTVDKTASKNFRLFHSWI